MKYREKFYLNSFGGDYYFTGSMIHGIEFRFDPIPCTGAYRRGKYYRNMRTTQELRWNCAHIDFTRGKRRKKILPNSWDDYPRRDWKNKNWKNCTKRRQQYK